MTLAINEQRLAKPGPQNAALRDYDCVRRAIAFISEHWRAQPAIEAMADAAGVTPDELHHLFRRWAGLTPKAFMQALTLDHAKGPVARFRHRAGCSTRLWIVRAGDGCTICSSPMRRCRQASGRTAAPA